MITRSFEYTNNQFKNQNNIFYINNVKFKSIKTYQRLNNKIILILSSQSKKILKKIKHINLPSISLLGCQSVIRVQNYLIIFLEETLSQLKY